MNLDIHQLLLHIMNLIVLLIPFIAIWGIIRAVKKSNDHTNGTAPRTGAGKAKYTYTYNAKQKQNQDEKPPWEE